MTFYNDLADEVDQHFARALHSAKSNNQDLSLVQESGKLLLIRFKIPHTIWVCYVSTAG